MMKLPLLRGPFIPYCAYCSCSPVIIVTSCKPNTREPAGIRLPIPQLCDPRPCLSRIIPSLCIAGTILSFCSAISSSPSLLLPSPSLHHGILIRSRRVRIFTTATDRDRTETYHSTQTEPKCHIQPTNIDSQSTT
jgi:hypothetical protein